ncbi:hypothetical protein ILUMI_07363 [Ignelater luminosus]|uniref:Reverse transcriptase RNase H-like domain-containing protein n=1 Tax=Ignelater luminosus TaxID=2038154 RepID=A0A8K0D7K6_IGNLU|nr:hypothetical protein ILUMI_07363 [Ignelater luminosus]
MSNEQFQQLLQSLMNVQVRNSDTPTAEVQSEATSGNLANCTARFKGSKGDDVKAFIDAMEIYKDCIHVSDAKALKGLPMLLEDSAATRELFLSEQDSETPQIFLSVKHVLPPDTLPEAVQLAEKISAIVCRLEPKNVRKFVCGIEDISAAFPRSRPLCELTLETKRNCSCTEREALAIIFALQRFRGHIKGSEILVTSDRQGLRWLMNIKSPMGRLARWALLIQSFNVKIDYLPGRRNVVANTLSRSPFPELPPEEEIPMCMVSITIPGRIQSEIQTQQLEDPELAKIIHSFEDPDDWDLPKWKEAALVSRQERDRVLYEYHDRDLSSRVPEKPMKPSKIGTKYMQI